MFKIFKTNQKFNNLFPPLSQLNLWGNRCDLSFSGGADVKPDSDPFSLLDNLDAFIVSDGTRAVWECVRSAKRNPPAAVVDIINDNSGYELFTDLCLADFLIEHGLAARVNFNVKAIPWYISDVTPNDMMLTLETLEGHENALLANFGRRLKSRFAEGTLDLKDVNNFWTSPYEFCRMREINPELYEELSRSDLVIFKGDLNYRKLLGDYNFPHSTPFRESLRGFTPTNLCTLRTVKADLISGLEEGLSEKLTAKDPRWMTTGEYGVIQFSHK